MNIAVIGGGVAGLFCARAIARQGHRATLFEPDASHASDDADDAFLQWRRPGVPQFRQPHNARAFLREALQRTDPTLLDGMVGAGMKLHQWRLSEALQRATGDYSDLVSLQGRRAALELPLRRIVYAMENVTTVQLPVQRMLIDNKDGHLQVAGLQTSAGELRFDAVVEASGRRSKIAKWIEDAGGPRQYELTSDCGITYYTRHFRFHEHVEVPSMPPNSGFGPSVGLPGIQISLNASDCRTFSLMLAVRSTREEFRVLRHDAAHRQFLMSFPKVASWMKIAEPLRNVEPFAGLKNCYRRFVDGGRPVVDGLFVVGDARVHTNPLHGWGMSFAWQMSEYLREALEGFGSVREQTMAFEVKADPYARMYYRANEMEDAARLELWDEPDEIVDRGEPGSYRFFLSTVQPAMQRHPEIFHAAMRREHLLDDPDKIIHDAHIHKLALGIGASLDRSASLRQLCERALQGTERVV